MTRLLQRLLAISSLAFVLLYLSVALARCRYPYDLEWLEGQAAAAVARVAAGERIYVEPSLDHVPEVYTPLYFYLAALPSALLGPGLPPLRSLSVLFSLASLALLWRWAARESGNRLHGLLAAGLFAATFPLSGYWFDLARVDSTFLFLLLLALYLARFGASRGSGLAAGLALSAALLTKQTGAILIIPLAIYCLTTGHRRGLAFLGSVAAATGGALLALHLLHGRWFFYYTLLLPARDALRPEMILRFWWSDLLLPLPAACGLAAWYLAAGARRQSAGPQGQAAEPQRRADELRQQAGGPRRQADEPRILKGALAAGGNHARLFYLLASGGMLAIAWLGRIHRGGYANVLLPAHAFLALLFALGLARAETAWEEAQRRRMAARPMKSKALSAARQFQGKGSLPAAEGCPAKAGLADGWPGSWISQFRWPALILPAIYLAALLQFLLLAYDPRTQLPTRADRQAGAALVARLAALDGPLLVPEHCFLPVLAGKESCGGRGAMMPILAGPEDAVRRAFVELGLRDIREQRFKAVILDRERFGPFLPELKAHYRKESSSLNADGETLWTRTGRRTRPESLYLPRSD